MDSQQLSNGLAMNNNHLDDDELEQIRCVFFDVYIALSNYSRIRRYEDFTTIGSPQSRVCKRPADQLVFV
jgi:hypothetical protein